MVHTHPHQRPGLQAPTPIQRPWRGLPAVLPISRQGGMAVWPMGSTRPLRPLEAGEKLTAWNLVGEE